MTSITIAKDIATRFLGASVQGGARPGNIIGPEFLQGMVRLPGLMADFPAGMDYAAEQGWVEKLSDNQFRLTDAGFAAVSD
jgi:hypothetical protein